MACLRWNKVQVSIEFEDGLNREDLAVASTIDIKPIVTENDVYAHDAQIFTRWAEARKQSQTALRRCFSNMIVISTRELEP